MSNLSHRALALSAAYGTPDPGVDWERMAEVVKRLIVAERVRIIQAVENAMPQVEEVNRG